MEINELSDSELLDLYHQELDLADSYDNMQFAYKVMINALYGALANPGFLLNKMIIACAITSNSRFYVNLFGNLIDSKCKEIDKNPNYGYRRYADTDSGYFEFPKKLPIEYNVDSLDKIVEGVFQPIVNKSSEIVEYIFNAFSKGKLVTKREAIFENAIFVAKKRYAIAVLDDEGTRYDPPKIKVHGLDIIRSSTPSFCRKYLSEAVKILMKADLNAIKNWLAEVRKIYLAQPLSSIAKVSSVTKDNYDLKTSKAIPINSRAFLVTNQYIDANPERFQKLELGSKYKMLYLREPNPLKSNIFMFDSDTFANQFRDFIDFDLNFEKFFLVPLELMIEPLGYDLRANTDNLEDLW